MKSEDIVYVDFDEEDFKNGAIFSDHDVNAEVNLKRRPTSSMLIRPLAFGGDTTTFEFVDAPGAEMVLRRDTQHTAEESRWIP